MNRYVFSLMCAQIIGVPGPCETRAQERLEDAFVARPSVSPDEQDREFDPRGQFSFCTSADPRTVGVVRMGSKDRPSEVSVFEIVRSGERLRRLGSLALEGRPRPLKLFLLGGGRYVVSLGEFEGGWTTDNCVVVYDCRRNERNAMSLEEFLPERITTALRPSPVFRGKDWTRGSSGFDVTNQLFIPNMRAEVGEGYPFVVVDLRDRSASVRSDGDAWPSTFERFSSPEEVVWDWSMGKEAYPEIDAQFALPCLLRAVVDSGVASAELQRFFGERDQVYYRLDSQSGDYEACSPEDWVPRLPAATAVDRTKENDKDREKCGSEQREDEEDRRGVVRR